MKSPILILLSLISFTSLGQINGNGKVVKKSFSIENIETIDIGIVVDAEITIGENEFLEIEMDENLFEYLELQTSNRQLSFDQKQWIEPSKTIKIRANIKALSQLKNSAWGTIAVNNVDSESLKVEMSVGELNISGNVDSLYLETNVAKVYASELSSQIAKVSIHSRAKVELNVSNELFANGKGQGAVILTNNRASVYRQSNTLFIGTRQELKALFGQSSSVKKVSVKLKNPNWSRVHIRFEGPLDAPFGYGTAIGAKRSKREKLPIGTKIFIVDKDDQEKLFTTIKSENTNRTIVLGNTQPL